MILLSGVLAVGVIGFGCLVGSFAARFVGVPGWVVPVGCLLLLAVGTPARGDSVYKFTLRMWGVTC